MPAVWKVGASAMRHAPVAAFPVIGHDEELEPHFGPSTDLTTSNVGICLGNCSSVDVVQPFQTAPWGNLTRLLYAVRQGNLWRSYCHNLCRQRPCAPLKQEPVPVGVAPELILVAQKSNWLLWHKNRFVWDMSRLLWHKRRFF